MPIAELVAEYRAGGSKHLHPPAAREVELKFDDYSIRIQQMGPEELKEAWEALWATPAGEDRVGLRNKISEHYLPLVHCQAKWQSRFRSRRQQHTLEDRFSAGWIELARSVGTFEPERGNVFETYAWRNVGFQILSLNRGHSRTEKWNNALPLLGDLLWKNRNSRDGEDDRYGSAIPDKRKSDRNEIENRDAIDFELSRMRERDAAIIRMRYWDGATLVEISKRFGITKERVRQLLVRSEGKLFERIKQ